MSGVMPPPGPLQGAAPPMGPVGVPPGAMPNPAFAQWQQAYQRQQQIVAANAQKTAQFEAACKLIRDDGVRGFRLDIEADSTAAPDEMAEQASRVSFLQQIVPLIQQITPIAQGNPEMAKLAGEIAMFAVRGFRVARTLEEAFETAFQVLGTMPPPAPKGGTGAHVDPQLEQAKLMAQVHDTQTRAQSAQTVATAKAQTDQTVAATKAQTDQMAIAQKQQQAALQYQAAQERADQEDQNNQSRLMLEAEKLHSAERMNQARVEQMASRVASRLT